MPTILCNVRFIDRILFIAVINYSVFVAFSVVKFSQCNDDVICCLFDSGTVNLWSPDTGKLIDNKLIGDFPATLPMTSSTFSPQLTPKAQSNANAASLNMTAKEDMYRSEIYWSMKETATQGKLRCLSTFDNAMVVAMSDGIYVCDFEINPL